MIAFKNGKAGILLLAVCLVATLARAGTTSDDKSPRNDPSRSAAYLEREVGHQLRLLPFFTVFDNLEYRVDGYRVELMGEVTRPTLKSDAENAVKNIEGVESVTNNIKVLPVSPNDDAIRMAEYRAIYGHSDLNRYAMSAVPSIHIVVENGHVTLVGVTANEMDKNIAGIQAKGVPGVFSVTNNLRVEGK
jgi:hyperosmotically inducible protein